MGFRVLEFWVSNQDDKYLKMPAKPENPLHTTHGSVFLYNVLISTYHGCKKTGFQVFGFLCLRIILQPR